MIKSGDGYVFAKKDKSAIYDDIMYLGCNDSIDNYIEITVEEAEELKKMREEENNVN